jgi:hypothetical protein
MIGADLFGNPARDRINKVLAEHHYLGPTSRGRYYFSDDVSILVFGRPAARHLPSDWLELQRWCIVSRIPNGGSSSWKRYRRPLPRVQLALGPDMASDRNSADGPRLLGQGVRQEAKDRWVYPLRPDERREKILEMGESYRRRFPGVSYREPKWKKGHPILQTGGGDFKQFCVAKGSPEGTTFGEGGSTPPPRSKLDGASKAVVS